MKIYFDGTLIDSDNYISFSNEFKQFDETFLLGTTASNTITIEVPSTIAIPTNVLIKINETNYASLIVDSYEYEDNNILKLNLVDKMVLLDFNYNAQSIVPCTVKQILQNICLQAGITLATNSFTNDSLVVDYYDNTLTAREYVGMIAELNGGFARINTSGGLELVKFSGTPTDIDIETCEEFRIGEKHKIERVVFDSGILKFESSTDESLETLYLNNQNVYITNETVFNNIANEILNFEFYCFSTGNCEIKPTVKAGDLINFTDGENNYPTIAQYDVSFMGGLNGGYELNINSKKQEETKVIGVSESFKRLRIEVNRDLNQITETIEGQIDGIEKEINPTQIASGSSIYLEDSAEAELIDFELEGKTTQASTPTPDNPSELVSVGYKNILDLKDGTYTATDITANVSNGKITLNGTAGATRFVDIPLNTNLNISLNDVVTLSTNNPVANSNVKFRIDTSGYLDTTLNSIDKVNTINITYATFTNGITIRVQSGTTLSNFELTPVISKDTQAHSYIPYGKYGIEVKTTGKNLINQATIENGVFILTSNGVRQSNSVWSQSDYIKINKNTDYIVNNTTILSGDGSFEYSLYDENKNWLSSRQIGSATYNYATFTTDSSSYYVKVGFRNDRVDASTLQLEKGTTATDYEPYVSNTNLITLDEPLRSIGDTKDLLYIKNGMLCVERKIGSVVLDGSENGWSKGNYTFVNNAIFTDKPQSMCSHFIDAGSTWVSSNETYRGKYTTTNSTAQFKCMPLVDMTLTDFKTWLASNNVELQYVLAEPYIEELGQVDMPSTYKGVTCLNTTETLEPNMAITYARDTLIVNYVENHVSELKITEKSIESRVQTIEESDYGGQISAVEERTTSTEKNIEVISTNIDTTTGEVRKVATTNGMTFDENGLNIHTNQSTFNAQHTYEGTYYRDGEEVITETTINGFKATNLKNKGQHEYSYDDTNDIYEFIDERVEADGEYCYATFYNGEE